MKIDLSIWRITQRIHEDGVIRIQLVNKKTGKPKTWTISK